MQSERSQSQRITYPIISFIKNLQNGKSIEREITFLVSRDWEEGGVKVITNGGRISFYGEGQVLELEGG